MVAALNLLSYVDSDFIPFNLMIMAKIFLPLALIGSLEMGIKAFSLRGFNGV